MLFQRYARLPRDIAPRAAFDTLFQFFAARQARRASDADAAAAIPPPAVKMPPPPAAER